MLTGRRKGQASSWASNWSRIVLKTVQKNKFDFKREEDAVLVQMFGSVGRDGSFEN